MTIKLSERLQLNGMIDYNPFRLYFISEINGLIVTDDPFQQSKVLNEKYF